MAELEADASEGPLFGGGDSEEEREAALLQLRLAALQAAEQRAMLKQVRRLGHPAAPRPPCSLCSST